MGSVVKHVTGALTGHSGGGKSKTTTTESSNTQNQSQSWLEKNPQYQALQNNALREANNFNMPQYQVAGQTADTRSALAALARGVDTSQYRSASQQMISQGQSAYNQGGQTLRSAQNTLNSLGNMTQKQYQDMMKSEYNSDLVKSQIAQMTSDVNDEYNSQVHALNQSANASGAMGNSRAGVAQGVMAGQAQKAIASGTVQYQTAEEQNAYNRLTGYLTQRTNVASSLASIGQNQQSQGLQQYGAGMGYYSQYNQAVTQNAQNRLTAGQAQQQYAQQVIDVNRQNALIARSPALARLAYYNQTLLPMANLSTSGTASGTGTNTSVGTQPSSGGNLLGGLMGMAGSAVGTYFGGSMGGQMGGMLGGAFGNSYGR
ncbi:hypothetical protein QUR06_000263 [Escherichia coli]|nr:hypothetical protein [Escherichia coli]